MQYPRTKSLEEKQDLIESQGSTIVSSQQQLFHWFKKTWIKAKLSEVTIA